MADSEPAAEDELEPHARLIEAEMARVARRKAVHEAGHCVVALHFGWHVDLTTIDEFDKAGAHSELLHRTADSNSRSHQAQVTVAGALAVLIDNHWVPLPSNQDGAVVDDKFLYEVLCEAPPPIPESDRPTYREESRRAARPILEGNWHQVEALTAALLAETTLDRARIAAVIETAIGARRGRIS
ncbi:MAG TPA: hypothetical protein VK679_20420 [Gemmatimonadaceae bacterium]|jgi:hypothetical protein|nr:hypothetical protein [Gemmatimonadaceae bacterium]